MGGHTARNRIAWIIWSSARPPLWKPGQVNHRQLRTADTQCGNIAAQSDMSNRSAARRVEITGRAGPDVLAFVKRTIEGNATCDRERDCFARRARVLTRRVRLGGRCIRCDWTIFGRKPLTERADDGLGERIAAVLPVVDQERTGGDTADQASDGHQRAGHQDTDQKPGNTQSDTASVGQNAGRQ